MRVRVLPVGMAGIAQDTKRAIAPQMIVPLWSESQQFTFNIPYIKITVFSTAKKDTRKDEFCFISLLSKLSLVRMYLKKHCPCCAVKKIHSTTPTCNLYRIYYISCYFLDLLHTGASIFSPKCIVFPPVGELRKGSVRLLTLNCQRC